MSKSVEKRLRVQLRGNKGLIIALLEDLSPEERLEVWGEFCKECGGPSGCLCWRDE